MTLRGRRVFPPRFAALPIFIGLLGAQARADVAPEFNRSVSRSRIITNPDWIRRPTGYEMSEFYPPSALAMRLGGLATIDCAVVVDGTMEDCRIVSEEPYGLGFGDAAMKMTAFFAMRPKLVDGVPVAGARVIIPIRFKMPSAPEPTSAGSPPPTPKALALGRRIISAQHLDSVLRQYVDHDVEAFAGGLETSSAGVLAPDVEAEIKVAKDGAYADIPAYIENNAAIVASSLPEAQLETIAAFLESQDGQAWTKATVASRADFNRLSEEFGKSIYRRLCNATRCTPRPIKP